MNKSFLAVVLLSSTIFTLQSAEAQRLGIDELKDRGNESFIYPRLVKTDGAYFITLMNSAYFDRNGNQISASKARSSNDEFYSLQRNVKIPVNILFEHKDRTGGKFQGLGFGDDDERTGSFENYKNQKVEDLFSRYNGTSFNAGVVFIGGGYSKAISERNIELSEGNGSILFPGPAGMPMGINAGFEKLEYTFVIKAPLKAAQVDYQFLGYVDRKVIARETRSESLDMETILKAELR